LRWLKASILPFFVRYIRSTGNHHNAVAPPGIQAGTKETNLNPTIGKNRSTQLNSWTVGLRRFWYAEEEYWIYRLGYAVHYPAHSGIFPSTEERYRGQRE
jgi:hypothetical protein